MFIQGHLGNPAVVRGFLEFTGVEEATYKIGAFRVCGRAVAPACKGAPHRIRRAQLSML